MKKKRYGIEITCPACKIDKAKVFFRMPNLLTPVMTSVTCECCESVIMVKVVVRSPRKAEKFDIGVAIQRLSEKAAQMIREEAEHNAKSLDEIDLSAKQAAEDLSTDPESATAARSTTT